MAKKTRKELLKKDDAFLAAAGQGAEWIGENKGKVGALVVLTFAAIAGLLGGREYMNQRNTEASLILEEAQQLMVAEIATEGADPEGDPPTYPNEEERDIAVRQKLDEVVATAGSGGIGVLARFYLADMDVKAGDKEKAEAAFAELVDSLSTQDSLYFLAVERTAYLQEDRGDTDAALETLGRIITPQYGFYGDRARFHQARIYMSKGDKDRARNLLQAVDENYSESSISTEVKALLRLLGPGEPKPSEATASSDTGEKTDEETQTP